METEPVPIAPCGETPGTLFLREAGGYKYAHVHGSCCEEWCVEFYTSYRPITSEQCYALARTAWNRARRLGRMKPGFEFVEGPHRCAPSWATDAENIQSYDCAVEYCEERVDGEFWVGNGEYETRVNFCPFCGASAPKPAEAGAHQTSEVKR